MKRDNFIIMYSIRIPHECLKKGEKVLSLLTDKLANFFGIIFMANYENQRTVIDRFVHKKNLDNRNSVLFKILTN